MLKYFFILISSFLFCNSCFAEKQDTLLYLMKNSGHFVTQKDSADYFLFIMPSGKIDDENLFPVYEYYPNGRIKLIAASQNQAYNALIFEGTCTRFFKNRKRMSVSKYKNGELIGGETRYYINGNLNSTDTIENGRTLYISCYDSIGNVLAEKGNGKWVKYDDDQKNVVAEGMVKDSLEDGEWILADINNKKFTVEYKQGFATSSSNPGFPAGEVFTEVDHKAVFSIKNGNYLDFLLKNLHYPINARDNNIQGRVVIKFIVEKNGTLSNIKLNSISNKDLAAEAIRVVKLMSFDPAIKNNVPVRSYFTLPINFTIGHEQ